MSIALIADAHLGGPGGDAAPFVAQLEALAEGGCRRLVLLGDIFHFWVGAPHFETAEIRAVTPVLRRLRQSGVAIDYVEGNRDFFLEASPYRDCFDRLGREVFFETGGRRYLAIHGDGLNAGDRRYLFWRWLSKSRLTRFLVRRLPEAVVQRNMRSTEERLAKTNFKHRLAIPERAILRYGGRRLAEGYDVLYLGHFHEGRRWRLPGGEIRLLEAWFHRHHVERLPGAGAAGG